VIEQQQHGVIDKFVYQLFTRDGGAEFVCFGMGIVYPDSQFFGWLVAVLESHEIAAPEEGIADIVAQVAERACVSVLKGDEVEGWLAPWDGGCEPQGFTAPVFNQEAAPCLDGFSYRLFAVDDFHFAHMGIIPDFV